MIKYVFDVDGTLTPSRGKINEDFRLWFIDFCIRNKVYLVTGSDYDKTYEQLGEYLLRHIETIYNCSGSDVWSKGKRVRTSTWSIPNDLRANLNLWLESSKFPIRAGLHIEERPGSANFSIVGRKASHKERLEYVEWDTQTNERKKIAKKINTLFPNVTASVGGETGLDLYPKGNDKSQILKDFEGDIIYFFGDKMDPDGNDYPLSSRLSDPSKSFQVRDWKHTFEILKEIED